jgi:glycogen operon protein
LPQPTSPHPKSGLSFPQGATPLAGGVNFAVFSKYADHVQLLLFNGPEDPSPAQVIELDPDQNRTGYYWHLFVPGIGHGQVYAWRVHGPDRPDLGHRFDGEKALIDPFGLAVAGQEIYDRKAACRPGDNTARALRSVVIDPAIYDWEGDQPLAPPKGRELVYEMHVGAFTAHPSSGLDERTRGTYAGLVSKIGHLKELGVTTVELLPVHQFDTQDAPTGLTNYWGYSSVSFFAPHAGFSSDGSPTGPVDEFRDMVKALHRAGIRVVLDVVFNHTAEAGDGGPILSWRGFGNNAYYLLGEDRSEFVDFTGCGNTVNANHSIVRRMILASLRHWVRHMHIDGFRFDLAAALCRGEDGHPMANPPVLWGIESDPMLAGTTLVAEPWDLGQHLTGRFPGHGFAQWNDRYRDSARSFWRGDEGTIEELMGRIVGSPDLFSGPEQTPYDSVNFVTCHDGFCLRDLVSYTTKRNDANLEGGRDGSNNNLGSNGGIEGETDDPEVLEYRARQVRNFLTLLFLSHGTPLLLMGDESGHTRRGNNNPWCQDNDFNWVDWSPGPSRDGLMRFVKGLVALSRSIPLLQADHFWTATSDKARGEITWHGGVLGRPDWSATSRALAWTLADPDGGPAIHVMMNASEKNIDFEVPPAQAGSPWLRVVATHREVPADLEPIAQAQPVSEKELSVGAGSVTVLFRQA